MKSGFRVFLSTIFAFQTAWMNTAIAAPKPALSKVPLKYYFLSFESLTNLNETERTAYLMGLSQLLMVREYSQDHFVGKISKSDRQPAGDEMLEPILQTVFSTPSEEEGSKPAPESSVQPLDSHQSYARFPLVGAFVEKAEAFWGLALASATRVAATSRWVGGALTKARGFLAENFSGSKVMGFLRLKAGQEVTKDSAKFAAKVGLGKELEAGALARITELRKLGKETIEAQKALSKSKIGSDAYNLAQIDLNKKGKALKKLVSEISSGTDEISKNIFAELNKSSWGKKLLAWGVGGSLLLPVTGVVSTEQLNGLVETAKGWVGKGEEPKPVEKSGTSDEEIEKKVSEQGGTALIPWEPKEDKGCIYGMRASKWEMKKGVAYCVRPPETKKNECNPPGEKSYPCPNFGLATEPPDAGAFCVPTKELKDLSERCEKKLRELLDKKNVKITKENYDKFLSEVKFLGADGEQTLEQYCAGASVKQGTECGALMAIKKSFESMNGIKTEIAKAEKIELPPPPPAATPASPPAASSDPVAPPPTPAGADASPAPKK